MFITKRSKWFSMLVLAAVLMSTLAMQPGVAMASTQAPVITPGGGTFTSAQNVTINNIPDGDQAYYTIDGSNPTSSTTAVLYSDAFTVSESKTVKAAVLDSMSGWSRIASAAFVIRDEDTVQAPGIYPNGGTFTSARNVTLNNISAGDQAYYTTDGSNPTSSATATLYAGPFTVSESETVKAATNDPAVGWSTVTTAVFVIKVQNTVLTPIIYPHGGTFSTAQNVTISNISTGDSAYYTTDGSNPASSATAILYAGPFTVSESETVKAAAHDATAGWSSVASVAFTINASSLVEAPVIDPNGGTFSSARSVTIGNIPDDDYAYYTTDGSNPTTSSTAVIYDGAFTVDQSEKVMAANHDAVNGWSTVVSANFVVGEDQTGSTSDDLAQLKEEFADAVNNNQMAQAMRILQEIKQLKKHNTSEDHLNKLKEQLISAVDSNNWNKAQAFLKQIIKLEGSDWAYSQLGKIYQQEGNDNVNVFSNGDQLDFDVQPIIVNGRTLIPIRKIANAFGLSDNDIQWDPKGIVTIKNGSNKISIGENAQQIYLDGVAYPIDVPAQVHNGRMMIPLKAVGQLFHKKVQWYPNGNIVAIS
ncbi:MAG TPA: chitobiase/beta-hexosaminidase C-terminal domain-containing protein [Syntrophomonadaceae bacterium]|nr:chitobiase/beta-hexosaminidase C-terminal domain-containing protein [Syntrophomonadaceae bacterium]